MTAKQFWEDFIDIEERLRLDLDTTIEERNFTTFSYLCAQLDDYCFGLTPNILAPEKDSNKIFVFTISCAGNRDLLIYVNRLVDEAPKMKYWKIKALVEGKIETDPKIMSEPFKCNNFSITPKDIRFTVYSKAKEQNIFDLLLLLPLSLSEVDDTELENAFLTIFEELWGERFVGEKINCLLFTYNACFEEDFFELEMLKDCLDFFE